MAEVPELKIEYGDRSRGILHWQRIKYGDLTEDVRDKIEATDLTVHELQELNIIEDKITNLHLMKLSGEEITSEDVKWPL